MVDRKLFKNQEVRSMSKAFRMYLLHPDDDLSCALGTCKCAAWTQRAGCILCIWTRARLAAGHAALRAYTPRGRESTRRRSDDEMRSDGLWKGRSGGIGYAARDMARQVKWEDPALRREREKERERTRASGRRACEKEEREKERASESENEGREDSREGAREARE